MSQEFDKKRANDTGSHSVNKKRKALNELSEDGPLTQDDVLYFKKEAIWRQMMMYKEKSLMLNKDLAALKNKYESSLTKLSVIDKWYEQILDVMKGADDVEDVNNDILVSLPDGKILDDALESRRIELLKVLTRIDKNVTKSISDKELLEQRDLLRGEIFKIKAQNEKLSKQKEELDSKVEELQNDVLKTATHSQRQQSKTVLRASEIPNGKEEVKQEKEESVEKNVNNDEYEKLVVQVDELKSENESLARNLDETGESLKQTKSELLTISNRLSQLTEEDLQNSTLYQDLKVHSQNLEKEMNNVQRANEQTIKKLGELENSRNNFKKLLDADLISENESLKSQLHKSEEDLIRIRTIRDELLSKQTILKAESDNKQTNESLQKLNEALSKRLDSLEIQQSKEYDTMTVDGLSEEEMKKRLVMLLTEIKEIESAFQEARQASLKKLATAVEHENLIKKLTIEKTKADQKYFTAMRSKDAISSENKILKAQVNKSQELINKFNELEKTYNTKIESLAKSLDDYRLIKQNSVEENSKLKEHGVSLSKKLALTEAEFKRLKVKYEEASKDLAKSTTDIASKNITLSKTEAKLKSTESLLKKYKSNNTSSILQEDEKQLEALRSIAKCSVCSKNWKDTAITVCGHVFCNTCTQERLAARLRRCPSCNKGFSANDLLSIHL